MKSIILLFLLIGVLFLLKDRWELLLPRSNGRKGKGFFGTLLSGFDRSLEEGRCSHLWKELQYLSGSEATARRLVFHAKIHHPDKPEHWHLEKAIYDLKRDR